MVATSPQAIESHTPARRQRKSLRAGRSPLMLSPKHQLQRPSLTLMGCVLIAIGGCSGRPDTAQVSGKVLYQDGSAPTGGVRVVQFVPIDSTDAEIRKAASGQIKEDGSFTLSTRKPGDGVFLGEYAVTFTVWKAPREPVSLIKQQYTSAGTTPYKVTVDGDRDDLTFEIEKR